MADYRAIKFTEKSPWGIFNLELRVERDNPDFMFHFIIEGETSRIEVRLNDSDGQELVDFMHNEIKETEKEGDENA